MVGMRWLKHLFSGPWRLRLLFPKRSLDAIEAAIADSERAHMGEIRFAVESALDLGDLFRGVTARQRAIEVFSQARVWDTEHNSGVLIYLLLADRRVEIIADRGIHAKVGDAVWSVICQDMEAHFRSGDFERGVINGISAVNVILSQHFPITGANSNEMPNQPILV